MERAVKVRMEGCWGGHDKFYWRLSWADGDRGMRDSVPDTGSSNRDKTRARTLLRENHGLKKVRISVV
jgi:hypothetical protein